MNSTHNGSHPQLAFFGTVTASLSHELMNVLATIGEYSGLLQDLSGDPDPSGLDPTRLQSIVAKITRQVGRGEELVRRLNRFAHRADEVPKPVTTVELVRETIALAGRFAYLAQVTLETKIPESPQEQLVADPFPCGQALFIALQLAFEVAAERREVTVSLSEREPTVIISSADPFSPQHLPATQVSYLEELAASFGGRIEWIRQGDSEGLSLSLA